MCGEATLTRMSEVRRLMDRNGWARAESGERQEGPVKPGQTSAALSALSDINSAVESSVTTHESVITVHNEEVQSD